MHKNFILSEESHCLVLANRFLPSCANCKIPVQGEGFRMSHCLSGLLQILDYFLFTVITNKAFLSIDISCRLPQFSLLTGEATCCCFIQLKSNFLALKKKIRVLCTPRANVIIRYEQKQEQSFIFVSYHPWAQWIGKWGAISLAKCSWPEGGEG